MSDLYEDDYWSWTQAQARALKRRSGNELDWDRLAGEMDALGASEERELRSRYVVLLTHLLKWVYQPEKRSRSWTNTIAVQRHAIADHLKRNPGLKGLETQLFEDAYWQACREASSETDLAVESFPAEAPFTPDQAKDAGWTPPDA